MMKSLKVLSMAAAASVLAAPCALAERVVVKADIPFEFVVADRRVPSGQYTFAVTRDPGIVQIRSVKTGAHFATVSCQSLPVEAGAATVLVFDKHGSERFLRRIRSGDGSGVSLPQGRSEDQAEARVLAEARAQAAQAQAQAGAAAKTAMP